MTTHNPADSAPTGESTPSEETKHLAYAEAALMLTECIMSSLIENRILTVDQMVDAVETAIATKRQMVVDREHPDIASVAAGVLSTLANSLRAARV